MLLFACVTAISCALAAAMHFAVELPVLRVRNRVSAALLGMSVATRTASAEF